MTTCRESALQAAFCFAVSALFGCGASPSASSPQAPARTTENIRAEQALRRADDAWATGERTNAERLYHDFLRDFPRDPLEPLAILALARIGLASNSREGAEQALLRAEPLRDHADPVIARKASMICGIALHRTGREREAIDILSPLEPEWTVPEERALIAATIAEAAESVGDTISALRRLDALASSGSDSPARTQARAQIDAILESGSTLSAEARIAFARSIEQARFDPRGYTWARAVERAVQVSAAEGDREAVRALVESLRREEVELPEHVAMAAAQAERPISADPRAIGVLLPFDRQPWPPSREALRGLLLATEEPRDEPAHVGDFRLIWRGRAEEEASLAADIRELIAVHRVIAIVAVIDPNGGAVAQRIARELDIPFILLDLFSAPSPCVPNAEFSRRYFDAFGSEPGQEAGGAYESLVTLKALISAGATSRPALAQALSGAQWPSCVQGSVQAHPISR